MRRKFTVSALISLLMVAGQVLAPGLIKADEPGVPNCVRSDTTVKLSAVDVTNYHLAGWLCYQGSLENKTVQLLTSGLTYDHNYWDWPQQPANYSYVHAITNAGYAAFMYDRLGTGQSDKPDAVSLNLLTESYITHELVQGLRNGTVGGHAFSKIVSVGHSLGSAIAINEAASYQDIDGLVVSGFAHQPNVTNFASIAATLTPVQLDPQFANAGLPLGYITTGTNTRGDDFYYTPNADPAVISYDEQTKQTGTAGEFATFGNSLLPTATLPISVPVIVAVGQKDRLICDNGLLFACNTDADLLARESSGYNSHTCLETYALPNAGHDINLHLTSGDWFARAITWTNDRIGTNGTAPNNPCV